MNKKDCFLLGKITKPHGYKGSLKFYYYVNNAESYASIKAIFIEHNNSEKLIPYFIKNQSKSLADKTVLQLEDIDSIEKAIPLVNKEVYLPLSQEIIVQSPFEELIGFTVVDNKKGILGQIEAILDLNGLFLFQITVSQKEVLIPANKDFIKKIDKPKKEVLINMPDGLLELYL